MSEIWKPQDKIVYQGWVDAIICEASDELTSWETNFIEDMRTKLIMGHTLSQNQAEKLEQIYTNKTK